MKGDFTKLNFDSQKHYRSVFMQQGRLILDADWNEQRLIEAHLHRSQNQDIIGSKGAPRSKTFNHFEMLKAPGAPTDFLIAPGHFYIDGHLCELEGTPVNFSVIKRAGEAANTRTIKITTPRVDRQAWESGQWLQILSIDGAEAEEDAPPEPFFVKILTASPSSKSQSSFTTLTVELFSASPPDAAQPDLTGGTSGQLRRLATYTNQPHSSEALAIDADKPYLAYLDMWSRHITAIEDPTIAEKALNGADTTTRSQSLWQIKLASLNKEAKIKSAESGKNWVELVLEKKHQVSLTADIEGGTLQQTDSNQDNQLYRVEVHKGGSLEEVQLKWSSDNGILVSPIAAIEQSRIKVSNIGRDSFLSFHASQWVEVTDERREQQGQPGTLVQLTRVNDRYLDFDPAYVQGDAITAENFPNNPKVRGWDHNRNTAEPTIKLNLASTDTTQSAFKASAKITLERGITIQLQAERASKFNVGDYWLIPFRGGDNRDIEERLEWPREGDRPVPQPPHGIAHHYARLAILQPQSDSTDSSAKTVQDLRKQFASLTNCLETTDLSIPEELEIKGALNVTGKEEPPFGYVPANVRIGTQSPDGTSLQAPEARVQIKGAKVQATGTVANGGNQIVDIKRAARETQDLNTLVGSNIQIDGSNTSFRIEKASDRTLTLSQQINRGDGETVSFQYENALIQVNDSSETGQSTQLLVSPTGQVGLGLSNPLPDYRLSVRGSVAIGLDNFFEDSPPTDSEAGLWVQKNINTGGLNLASNLADIQKSDTVSFTIEPDASDHTQLHFRAKGGSDKPLSYVFKQGRVSVEKSLVVAESIVVGDAGFIGAQSAPETSLRVQKQIEADAIKINTVQTNSLQTDTLQATTSVRSGTVHADTIRSDTTVIQNTFSLGEAQFSKTTAGGVALRFNALSGHHGLSVNGPVAIGEVGFIGEDTQSEAAVDLLVQGLVETSGLKLSTRSAGNEGFFKLEVTEDDRPQLQFTPVPSDSSQTAHFLFSKGAVTVDESLSVGDRATIGNLDFTTLLQQPSDHKLLTQGALVAGVLELATVTTTDRNTALTSLATIRPIQSPDTSKVSFETQNEAYFEFVGGKVAITAEAEETIALEVQGKTVLGPTIIKNILSIGETDITSVEVTNASEKTGLRINQSVGIQAQPDSAFALNVEGDIQASKFHEQSSIALKQDVSELSIQEAISYLKTLDPIKFRFKSDDKNLLNLGFIAEAVPDIVASADKTAISPTDIIAILTRVAKFQERQLESCFDILRSHEGAIKTLSQKVAILEE